jgi:predicted membrane channel-forming protein YqfA (hemolysin III family)
VLPAIKLLHSVIWALLAGSIVALPVAGVLRRFRWAATITIIILSECGVLFMDRFAGQRGSLG